MTTDVQNQIYTTWLPLAITLVFLLIGLFRGVVREAIFATVVAVAAFINSLWAIQWGGGIHDIYSGADPQGAQAWLSIIVLWAISLILGYGLSGMLTKGPITPASRISGALLGLLSGGALAGWSLRYTITNTDGTLAPGGLLDSPVSRAFIIWATWFPLLLVFIGALV